MDNAGKAVDDGDSEENKPLNGTDVTAVGEISNLEDVDEVCLTTDVTCFISKDEKNDECANTVLVTWDINKDVEPVNIKVFIGIDTGMEVFEDGLLIDTTGWTEDAGMTEETISTDDTNLLWLDKEDCPNVVEMDIGSVFVTADMGSNVVDTDDDVFEDTCRLLIVSTGSTKDVGITEENTSTKDASLLKLEKEDCANAV